MWRRRLRRGRDWAEARIVALRSLSRQRSAVAWRRWVRRYWWLGLTLGLLVVVERGLSALGVMQSAAAPLCSLPGIHEYACRPFGLGGVPTAAQERRYRDALARGCSGLREYVSTESPDSPLMPLAKQRWETRLRQEVRPETISRRIEIFAHAEDAASREGAMTALDRETRRLGADRCSIFLQVPNRTLRSARATGEMPLCEASSLGWQCSASATVQCTIIWTRTITEERC
jgi:hypothetical protein